MTVSFFQFTKKIAWETGAQERHQILATKKVSSKYQILN